MRVLITGGAGFIGCYLAKELLSKGASVEVVDNLSTGKAENIPQDAFFSYGDCRDLSFLKRAAEGCSFVYHLASSVGVEKVLKNPSECILNNLDGMRAVLALGLPGLFTSTSEVYGKETGVLREDSDLRFSSKLRWNYAASKLLCEWLCLEKNVKVVRLFNVVGRGQLDGYVLSNFVGNVLAEKPIKIYGTGEQIRTFIDVRDAARILATLLRVSFSGPMNLGGIHSYTVEDLAYKVKAVLNSSVEVLHTAYSSVYPFGFEECPARVPSLDKLKGIVGPLSFTPLEDTIRSIAQCAQ